MSADPHVSHGSGGPVQCRPGQGPGCGADGCESLGHASPTCEPGAHPQLLTAAAVLGMETPNPSVPGKNSTFPGFPVPEREEEWASLNYWVPTQGGFLVERIEWGEVFGPNIGPTSRLVLRSKNWAQNSV